jgi:hypothetical protein
MSDIDEMWKLAIGASIWRPNSVDQEPETRLTNWAVFSVELEGGESTIHFAGYTGYEGRVCSPVKTYDPVTKRGVTQSGRVYELVPDRPGLNGDADYVWHNWLRRNGNPKFTDVTEVYL